MLGKLLHLNPGGLGKLLCNFGGLEKLLGPDGLGKILLDPVGVVSYDGLVPGAA